MRHRLAYFAFALVFIFANAGPVLAEVTTPPSNLSGVWQVQERIDVSLSLKGADEFGVESSEVIKIVRAAIIQSGIAFVKGDIGTPSIHVDITGVSAGGGGAEFLVEMVINASIPSPFATDRSIEAIIWRASAAGRHLMRYDPVAKGMVKPIGAIKDRIYDAIREVTTRFATDAKIAGIGAK